MGSVHWSVWMTTTVLVKRQVSTSIPALSLALTLSLSLALTHIQTERPHPDFVHCMEYTICDVCMCVCFQGPSDANKRMQTTSSGPAEGNRASSDVDGSSEGDRGSGAGGAGEKACHLQVLLYCVLLLCSPARVTHSSIRNKTSRNTFSNLFSLEHST